MRLCAGAGRRSYCLEVTLHKRCSQTSGVCSSLQHCSTGSPPSADRDCWSRWQRWYHGHTTHLHTLYVTHLHTDNRHFHVTIVTWHWAGHRSGRDDQFYCLYLLSSTQQFRACLPRLRTGCWLSWLMFKLSAVTAEDVLQCCSACVGPCLVPAACAGETGETSAAPGLTAACSLLARVLQCCVLQCLGGAGHWPLTEACKLWPLSLQVSSEMRGARRVCSLHPHCSVSDHSALVLHV